MLVSDSVANPGDDLFAPEFLEVVSGAACTVFWFALLAYVRTCSANCEAVKPLGRVESAKTACAKRTFSCDFAGRRPYDDKCGIMPKLG